MDTVKAAILDLYDHTIVAHKRIHGLADVSKRIVARQKKINRCVALCAVSVTANLILIHYIVDEHDRKIKKLNKEIEELKNQKGE